MGYPVLADISSSGSNNLGTKINGQVGGNCNSGTCEITGGTASGINLFHRFSSFDTRGDIEKVNFEIGSQNNVIVGVTANTGTFINKPISLSSGIYIGFHLAESAQVQELTLLMFPSSP